MKKKIIVIHIISILFVFTAVSCILPQEVKAQDEKNSINVQETSEVDEKINSNGNPSSEYDEEFTDFSNAKVEIGNDLAWLYIVKISGTSKINEYSSVKAYVGDGSKMPTVDDANMNLMYSIEDNKWYGPYIQDYLELGSKTYLYVFEQNGDKTKLQMDKVEIDKTSLFSKYPETYTDSYIAYNGTQLMYNMPFGQETIRKINLKIGKINDTKILMDIKNSETYAFNNLLNYAKDNESPIYNKSLETNTWGGYKSTTALLESNQLKGGEYYYIYTQFDGENGKFFESECVSFAKVQKGYEDYYMFLYGNEGFEWSDFSTEDDKQKDNDQSDKQEDNKQDDKQKDNNQNVQNNNEQDNTIALVNFPRTGVNMTIIISIISIILIAVVLYKKYNSYKDIP